MIDRKIEDRKGLIYDRLKVFSEKTGLAIRLFTYNIKKPQYINCHKEQFDITLSLEERKDIWVLEETKVFTPK